jgi:hypothetical protein
MFNSVLFKVKENKINKWREWSKELMDRKNEALETIIEEKEIFEGSIDFQIGEDFFVIMYGYAEDDILPATEKEINLTHKKVKRECLEFISKPNNNYFLFDKNFNK